MIITLEFKFSKPNFHKSDVLLVTSISSKSSNSVWSNWNRRDV